MNEDFYITLIEELTRIKDIGGTVVDIKTYKLDDKDIYYSVEMQSRIDEIRIRINENVLVYNNGVYSSIETAIYSGIDVNDLLDVDKYVPENIDKDLKDTIDAAVTEFYKFNAKI